MDQTKTQENQKREDEDIISLISSLPVETDFLGRELFKYQGFWYFKTTVHGILNFQRGFEARDGDIIIASFPKSGTTWLKALTIALLERSKNSSLDDHPLVLDNPHNIIPFLEINIYSNSSKPDMTKFSSSSPRLFSTHLPLHTVQEALKNTPCKIVYVWRNVKDVAVSLWHFKFAMLKTEAERSMLESVFEWFCTGVGHYGPYWEHVLSYWRGSLEDSKTVLFLRYEDIKTEPHVQLKRLAEFLNCPFTVAEEESGSVEKILDLCSLPNLKNLEINKTGKTDEGIDHKDFFRKGEVGDSKNYLTPEMEKRIDMIIKDKFQGSDLIF